MVYLLRYCQSERNDTAHKQILNILDEFGYLHEVSRNEILFAPTCQIYFVRKRLMPYARNGNSLIITPVLLNAYEGRARGFVDFWSIVSSEDHRPPTTEELIAQLEA